MTPQHTSFSPFRIWTIAAGTVTQLVRMRILWALAILSLLVMGLGFAFPSVLGPEQQLKQLKEWSFSAIQIFFVIFSIAATSLLLPRDVEDRTLYTILCKPVPRHEYLIGKLLGMLLLVGAGMLVMDIVVCGVVGVKSAAVLAEMDNSLKVRNMVSASELETNRQIVQQYGLTWNMHGAVWSAFLNSAVICALTLLISCFATSTLFTILTSAACVVAGVGEPLARDFFLHGRFTHVVEKILSLILAMLCPDLSAFNLVGPAVRGEVITTDALLHVTGLAALYLVGYTAVAYLFFAEKEL